MTFAAGSRFGPYEIVAALGAGGMGEVYKARDTRLDRTVAIKVLPPSLAGDPEFRERFDREARTISQLEHADICALYDVGEQDGTSYLVMQYLEGETLEAWLTRGPLAIDQALQFAIQIGDALGKAHRAGIVHRDLKPGNIMITKSGAKLLDFGLAKEAAAVNIAAGVTTLPTPPLTAKGTILGTCQYMAPEQLEGLPADQRTDIWAFGAVIHEMLTGKPAFVGATPASIISSILKDQPKTISEYQPLTPTQLDRVVGRCLSKDPEGRWQEVGDLTGELRWIRSDLASTSARQPGSPPRERWALVAIVAAAALTGLGAGLFLARSTGNQSKDSGAKVTSVRLGIAPAERLQALPGDRSMVEGRPSRTAMAWAPDGRSVVFSAIQGDRQMLYVRALDRLEAVPIPGTEGGASPFFSPDGRWVGFWSNGALRKVAADGSGPATPICDAPNFYGGSWGADDTIIYARIPGLWRVSASGGTPQQLIKPDLQKGEAKYLLPQFLPDDRAVLFTLTHTPLPKWDDTEIVVQSLTTGERKVLVRGGADGRYVPSGHLLYVRRGTLMGARIDLQRLELIGGSIAMVDSVMQAANTPSEISDSGAGQFSVSSAGALLYLPGGIFPDPERSLVWVDRTGATKKLDLPSRAYLMPRISPDGRRVVMWTQGDRNIWVLDLARGVMTQLTSEGRNARAIWTPDGTRITYGSATAGAENLFWRPSDGSGSADRLSTSEKQHSAAVWSPDGRTLLFMELDPATGYDIWALDRDGDRRPRPIMQDRFNEDYVDFSPDGHWIAYVSNVSGETEVYVQPYPGPGPRQQISVNGGTAPAWSRDGRELFYTTTRSAGGQAVPTTMMVVPIRLHPTFDSGAPRMLFQGTFGATAAVRGYDVAPDGRRFLMVQQKERPPANASEMVLVQNWVEELRQKVPTN